MITAMRNWLRLWAAGSFPITRPQGKFFLKIDRTGVEITPFTRRGYYLKRTDR